ncbi:MAG TPA: hypothetical protein VFI45_06205 [Candidatus Acidoferrum sp.]|nr:hypothetical protein [Candidatus Acidoferrum sp.]
MGRKPTAVLLGTRKLALALLLGKIAFATDAPVAPAAAVDRSPIRVKALEVVVPVVVLDRSHFRMDRDSLFEEDEVVSGLSQKDFQIFEDGLPRPVQRVVLDAPRIRDVRDNVSHHLEYAMTPRGIWSTPDLRPQSGMGSGVSPFSVYMVSYIPAPSPDGVCHRIRVKVKRHHATVYARESYCNTAHPLSDPLKGTALGGEMERYAASGQDGTFIVSAQASPMLDATGAHELQVAVEFPWNAVKRRWKGVNLYANVAILGIINDQEGTEVARFSDMASTALWNFYRGPLPPDRQFLKDWELAGIPNRYTTQMNLPPGNYQLQVVVTDGENFGRVQRPLRVEDSPKENLSISGVILCKRIQSIPEGQEAAARAPQYVPLTGSGVEYSPAADIHFTRGENLFSFFEIYLPPDDRTATAETSFQVKLTNAESGELKVDTGLQQVGSHIQAETGIVSVSGEVPIEHLPPGRYRLNVQASDSNGRKTGWRESCFFIH